jgi:glutamate-1-semialdehyde 2,1-aminomutase
MSALRLARGATGRTKLVRFAGHYHGHSDALLAAAGSGLMTFGLPASAGVTPGAVADTIVLPWNDVAAVDAAFAEAGADIAVVACEPVAANMGVVPPAPGFLEHLRAVCTRHGAVLLFDEVITGFRLGLAGAQGHYGVTPDLSCFGKVVGGGLPLAAFGGRRDLMEQLAPVGPVYQAGTLSGNPLATAAGLAVLAELSAGAYDELAGRTARLADGLAGVFAAAGVAAQVPRVATLCGLFLADAPVVDQASASAADVAGYARFFHAMLDAGVYLAPSAFEALFVSLAHTDADVDRTLDAAAGAAALLAP